MRRKTVTAGELPSGEYRVIAGVDEAGRGPLCGPVVAACAAFKSPDGAFAALMRDSKTLSEVQRAALRVRIAHHCHWAVASVSVARIDEINIYHATQEAFKKAIERFLFVTGFAKSDCLFVIDGNGFAWDDYAFRCVVKADASVPQVSAASIMAKTFRDRQLARYDRLWPQYGFLAHKGYGTAKHREAIKAHGVLPIHRRSFALLPAEEQLGLDEIGTVG
jgi:ribonuclease HII